MALTLGDPAGVGPEIVLKAAADPETFRLCRPLAVGPAAVAAQQARELKIPVEVLTANIVNQPPTGRVKLFRRSYSVVGKNRA